MNQAKKNRLPLYIGIPVILLLLFVRFGLYFLKSDGFSGLSMLLPVLLLGFILFALCTSALFAAWVYQDCKERGDDPVLWAIVVFAATPFIGLLIYFLRRSEIKTTCPPADSASPPRQTTARNAVRILKRRTHVLWKNRERAAWRGLPPVL